MIKKVITKLYKAFKDFIVQKQLRMAHLDQVIIGPELNSNFQIRYPDRLYIGKKTVISGDCFINAFGGVKIGKYCHIAKGLTIYSHNHNWHSKEYIPYDNMEILRPVYIGDCVWIGCNVTIAPGTKIGNGVIISSGSVVFGEIPNCAIIRGNPAEIIGFRDQNTFDKLYAEGNFF